MLNFMYLVLLFLFLSIMVMSVYKYFRNKKWLLAIGNLIYILLTLLLTLCLFFSRNALKETEIKALWNGVMSGDFLAIFCFLFQVALPILSVINYVKVVDLLNKKRKK